MRKIAKDTVLIDNEVYKIVTPVEWQQSKSFDKQVMIIDRRTTFLLKLSDVQNENVQRS